MKIEALYEPPYTHFDTDGLIGVFSKTDSFEIQKILDSIKENAAA